MRIFPECGGLKTSPGHINSQKAKLNQQRKTGNEDYCDITLSCSGTRFPAHKAILSASSPYFECLLESQFAERTQNEIDLTESITDPETLECILEFIYTGNLLIEGHNFRELLGASSLLLLNDASELLTEYLKNSLVIANCLDIFELAFKYSLEDISQLCLTIIQARMHDYFCHGSKMLTVTPEVFLHLCKQDIFTDTDKQDTTNVIKEYIEHLKADNTEVSQEIARELYKVAGCYGTPNIDKLFEGLLEDRKVGPARGASKLIAAVKNENQNAEILLIRDKESNTDINLIGWLGKVSKWIKLASVNLTSIGCTSLGKFVGFAHDSMVYASKSNVIMIPFHAEQPRSVSNVDCRNFCDKWCTHFYFTAWNDLFCIYPETQYPAHDDGDYVYCETFEAYMNERNRQVVAQYKISKFSLQHNQWQHLCNLDLHDDYYDYYEREVAYASFQIFKNDKQVFLMVSSCYPQKMTSVIQLTQDATGKLGFQELFHTDKMQSPWNRSQVLVKSTPTKLRFQDICAPARQALKPSTCPVARITEVNTRTKKMKNIRMKPNEFSFPESKDEESRIFRRNVNQFVVSEQSGFIYYIDTVMPYVTTLWSFDPVKNEWKSLPGPPLDRKVDDLEMHYIPARLLPQIEASPPAIFEDKHDNAKHGPFG